MNSMTLKNKIKTLLSRFETLVRISSFNNEYDIHNHAETVLIPLLKLVYGWDLENINFEDKNAVSIDLIDRKNRIGIQVTSDTSLKKIKTTLQKFFQSKYKDEIDNLYFYLLVSKQRSYSSRTLPKAAKDKLGFTFKKHLIDNDTLYSRVKSFTSLKKIKEIEQLLASEFGDVNLTGEVLIDEYESFKEQYKAACLTNYSRLNFFGLHVSNKPREVELYSLFVKPTFQYSYESYDDLNTSSYGIIRRKVNNNLIEHIRPRLQSEANEAILSDDDIILEHSFYADRRVPFSELFERKNTVLLGSPGAGKSSLVKFSICKILEQDFKIFKDKEIYGYIPYRIELHKYNLFKKSGQGGFHEYIQHNLADEFQIDTTKPAYHAIVEKFPTIIFFDGLDEIFDIHERISVRNDIENFVKQNNKIRSIVTSRFESYSEVNFHRSLFRVLKVNDFDEGQIHEYVENWYSLEEDNEKLRKKEIRSCLNSLEGVDNQLKHNPLLLSLILILYRNEQDLPTSKLEIYEGCAQTLVETRDKKEKKLEFNLKVPHKISVFSNLAYWQFSSETNDAGVKINYTSIKNFISDYLLKKGLFEDRNEADDAANEFLDYAKLRSIYFENKFTHKTFYEYFVSHYIYSNFFSTPGRYEEFLNIMKENNGLSTWAIVLELLLCQVDNAQLEFTVMDGIIDTLLNDKLYATCYLFLGVLPHLKTVSPIKTKQLISGSIDYIINLENKTERRLALKERLAALIKNEKFLKIYRTIVSEKIDKANFNADVFEFAFELNSQLKQAVMDDLFSHYHDYISQKPETFILSILNAGTSNLESCETFLRRFGKQPFLDLYISNYGISWNAHEKVFSWPLELVKASKLKTDLPVIDKLIVAHSITTSDLEDHFTKLLGLDRGLRHAIYSFIQSSKESDTVSSSLWKASMSVPKSVYVSSYRMDQIE